MSARTIESPRALVALGLVLAAWFAALSYLPPLVGTCLDGTCEGTLGELAGLGVTLGVGTLPLVLERRLFGGGLRELGLTRVSGRSVFAALGFVAPLALVYPALAAATGGDVALRPGWILTLAGIALQAGLLEETMMRGFVFRHLREGRTFVRAAAMSTAYFAAYHVPMLWTHGAAIGVSAIVLAIPIGFVTAWLYELGEATVLGPALMHTLHNGLVSVVEPPVPWAPVVFMVSSAVLGAAVAVRVSRSS